MQPPPSPSAGEPLYEAFYGLREQPFALTTDPRFLYLSASHRFAFDELLTGLRRREGLLLLTGDTGTGKTTLMRAVIDALGHRTFSALILNPYMSDAEVLRVILRDFGLVNRDEIRRGVFANADMPQLLDTLESFLRSLLPLNSYAVLIIDEAQSLQPKVLDQIRMLGSFEQDGQRLLQIVLSGQPGLMKTISSEPMRALNERISRRVMLTPLLGDEVNAYIRHRLAIAGGRDAVSFQPEAVALIAKLSQGLPRRVNLLCDRSLEEGRVAGRTNLGPDLVNRASKAIAGNVPDEASAITLSDAPLDIDLDMLEMAPSTIPAVEAEPSRGSGGKIAGAIFGFLLLVAAAIGGTYAWHVVNDISLPAAPAAPKRDLPSTALGPLPNDDEIALWAKEKDPGQS